MRIIGLAAFATLMLMTAARAEHPFRFQFEEIADGVWAGVRADTARFPVMGNVTFVIGTDGVVVFDGGGMPLMAEQVLDKIRSLTDQPVTDIVISHWHGDHSFGIYRLVEAFPAARIIAHQFTSEMMLSKRLLYIDRERSFIDTNAEEFERIVATGIGSDGETHSAEDRAIYARILRDAAIIDEQLNAARLTPPTVTFDDRFTLDPGGKPIELLHLGAGNTAGDIVLWLPEDGVVATGDLVVAPSPFAFNVPPAAWIETLRRLQALDYALLVPGHGEVQHSDDYVALIIASVESLVSQRDTLLAAGKSGEAIAAALDFSAFEADFLQGNASLRGAWDAWFVEPMRAAAIKELEDGPMVPIERGEIIAFDDERWRIEAGEYALEEYQGQQALRLERGVAMLPDTDLRNAMVEFDIAFGPERGFGGLRFRARDNDNFEHVYLRPHQSGNPDANQYTPVFNGVSGWQLYHGEGYSVPIDYAHGEWISVRVVFAATQALVYIDSTEPVLVINDLKHGDVSGALGLDNNSLLPMHFANVRVTPLADAWYFPYPKPAEPADGIVKNWQVSRPFDSRELDGVTELVLSSEAPLQWQTLQAESNGVTNLARLHGVSDAGDTVFARFVMSMGEPDVQEMLFGYSDLARVFVNGELVYSGDNSYRSRDYRFLGTVGYFDRVPLRLQRGDNEILIAVTEQFGGWGVMARISEAGAHE